MRNPSEAKKTILDTRKRFRITSKAIGDHYRNTIQDNPHVFQVVTDLLDALGPGDLVYLSELTANGVHSREAKRMLGRKGFRPVPHSRDLFAAPARESDGGLSDADWLDKARRFAAIHDCSPDAALQLLWQEYALANNARRHPVLRHSTRRAAKAHSLLSARHLHPEQDDTARGDALCLPKPQGSVGVTSPTEEAATASGTSLHTGR